MIQLHTLRLPVDDIDSADVDIFVKNSDLNVMPVDRVR